MSWSDDVNKATVSRRYRRLFDRRILRVVGQLDSPSDLIRGEIAQLLSPARDRLSIDHPKAKLQDSDWPLVQALAETAALPIGSWQRALTGTSRPSDGESRNSLPQALSSSTWTSLSPQPLVPDLIGEEICPSVAGRPVDALAQEIGVSVMPRVLLDHVHENPAHRKRLIAAFPPVVE